METGKENRGRILVVDDEESVGRLLQQWLSSEGYQVAYASDFDTVRHLMEQQTFDLVTLDIMMPGTDGLEMLQWVQEHYPDIGAIMATAVGKLDTVIEAMRRGAINYLLKPFNLDLVGEEISRAIERQRLVAENRAYQQELERMVEERTGQLRQAQARLERQVEELEARDRLVHFQMEAHTLKEAYAEIFAVLRQVFACHRAIFYCPVSGGNRLQIAAAMGLTAPERVESDEQLSCLPDADEDSAAMGAFTQKRLVSDEAQVAVPILYRRQVAGVLCMEGALFVEEKEDACNALWRLAGEISLVLQGAAMAEELDKGDLSSLDELADWE